MNIKQTIKKKFQEIKSDSKDIKKAKQFTPEEEQEFIHSLIIDNEDEDWTEEDEIKFQRVITRLQR